MKLLFALFFPLFLVTPFFAQEGTTLEEYRYGSKGYGYQKEMGLDTEKDGYFIKELFSKEDKVNVIGLYNNQKQIKAMVFEFLNKENMTASYLCVPNPHTTQEVMQLFETDKASLLQGKQLALFHRTMTEFTFGLLNNPAKTDAPIAQKSPEYKSPNPPTTESIQTPESYELDTYQHPAPPATPEQETTETTAPPPILQTKGVDKTIEGDLKFRKVTVNPRLTTKTTRKGKVVIKICVNAEGKVTNARYTQKGSTLIDAKLIKQAEANAESIQFVPDEQKETCGTVEYRF